LLTAAAQVVSLGLSETPRGNFIAASPSAEELRRAVTYIREHWQRRYGLVQVG